jgi:hypothetical protein
MVCADAPVPLCIAEHLIWTDKRTCNALAGQDHCLELWRRQCWLPALFQVQRQTRLNTHQRWRDQRLPSDAFPGLEKTLGLVW